MVQWLRLHALTAKGWGSICGQGTKILQVKGYKKKETLNVEFSDALGRLERPTLSRGGRVERWYCLILACLGILLQSLLPERLG